MPPISAVIGLALLLAASAHACLTLLATLRWRWGEDASERTAHPSVTLLKPLCGHEPGLYEHLRSFCQQDYPQWQVIFGGRDADDPALAVARRLASEFPHLPIDIVIDPRQHGSNGKTSNLINMLARARHEVLVIADSDTWVGSDYLRCITAPLQRADVGLVSCLYRDVPTAGLWSKLGAMYINEWYMPAALLARLFGHRGYASGQTLCLRRETLAAIGGLEGMADHLADDHRLGELVRAQGLAIALSHYEVRAQHHEDSYDSLRQHELRWLRTVRVLKPRSFRWLFLSFSLPLALLGCLLTALTPAWRPWGLAGLAVTLLARIALHATANRGAARAHSSLWLIPLRDALLCWMWIQSLAGSGIRWRDRAFEVDARGVLHARPGEKV